MKQKKGPWNWCKTASLNIGELELPCLLAELLKIEAVHITQLNYSHFDFSKLMRGVADMM